MSQSDSVDNERLERFRGYLRVLAHSELASQLHARVGASDIVQEVLLKAHASFDQWRGANDAQLAGWLRKILATSISNALRFHHSDKRDVRREVDIFADLTRTTLRLAAFVDTGSVTPTRQARRNELLLHLADVLADLPADQRRAFLLKHWHGCSVEEVAQHLERTRAAAAGLIRRAMATLRRKLDDID